MKTLFATAIVLTVATAATGWADPAAADEPFELTTAELDRVTAGRHSNVQDITVNVSKTFSESGVLDVVTLDIASGDEVVVDFERGPGAGD